MGNTQYLNDDYCDMHIETEFPFYNSGAPLRGVVYLNTREQLINQSLYIRIEGNTPNIQVERGATGTKAAASTGDVMKASTTSTRWTLCWPNLMG